MRTWQATAGALLASFALHGQPVAAESKSAGSERQRQAQNDNDSYPDNIYLETVGSTGHATRRRVYPELLDQATGMMTPKFIIALLPAGCPHITHMGVDMDSTAAADIKETEEHVFNIHGGQLTPDQLARAYAIAFRHWEARQPKAGPRQNADEEAKPEQPALAAFTPETEQILNGRRVGIDIDLLGPNGELTVGFVASLDTHHNQSWRRFPADALDSTDAFDLYKHLVHLGHHGAPIIVPNGVDDVSVERIYRSAFEEWREKYKPDEHAEQESEQDRQTEPERPTRAAFTPEFGQTLNGRRVGIDLELLGPKGELTVGFVASLDTYHNQAWRNRPSDVLESTDPFALYRELVHLGHHNAPIIIRDGVDEVSVERIYDGALRQWRAKYEPEPEATHANSQSRPEPAPMR